MFCCHISYIVVTNADKPSFLAGHTMLNCKCWSTGIYVVGKFAIDQPYRNHILSQNCCFVISNPFSTIGSINSQFDTPFSWFISFGLFWSFVNGFSKICEMFLYRSSFSAFILLFIFFFYSWLYIFDLGWWLTLLAVWWLSWNFYIQNFLLHERMVYSLLSTVLVMITVFFRCQSKFDQLWKLELIFVG